MPDEDFEFVSVEEKFSDVENKDNELEIIEF